MALVETDRPQKMFVGSVPLGFAVHGVRGRFCSMGWGWFVFPAAGWLEYGKGKIGKIKKKNKQ